jgi:2,3-dihydroxybiphenyl 1,2-dioxygenase
MIRINALGYLVIEASDLPAWKAFATDVIGAAVGSETPDRLGLRIDEHPWRVLIVNGERDDLRAAGWELSSIDELEQFVAELRAMGAVVDPADPQSRLVSRLYTLADPAGFTHEFYAGRSGIDRESPMASPVVRGGGFVTGDLGVGHILPITKNYDAAIEWYRTVLGLRVSDRIVEEVAPGVTIDATFFHSATGRHHSLATAMAPGSKILNHFMLEYVSMDDVGAAFDRARAANIPIVMDLGHHPNDHMFSFYMETPSGVGLELGCGGVVIDKDDWTPTVYDKLSDWGHNRAPTHVGAPR